MTVPRTALFAGAHRTERRLWIGGAVLLAACAVGAAWRPREFFPSYLYAFLFWLGITLGSEAILLIHDLTGGAWGRATRRLFESAVAPLPLLLLLFVPLPFGLARLYSWARPRAAAGDAVLAEKAAYLNAPFWILRAAGYFALWILIAWLLRRGARARHATGSASRAARALSGPALIVYAFTATFAAIDWAMSLEPHWHSTVYGPLVLVGQGLGALAFTIAFAGFASTRLDWMPRLSEDVWNDLGNLLLTFVMLSGYLKVSQLIVIWSGNLPSETPWYLRRITGAWLGVALLLVAFQLAVPFLILLSRRAKRSALVLPRLAAMIAAAQLVDVFWRVVPAVRGGFAVQWMDVAAPLGIGAVWMAFFLRTFAVVPVPRPAA